MGVGSETRRKERGVRVTLKFKEQVEGLEGETECGIEGSVF